MYRDVQVPREDRMSEAAFPVGASLSHIPALQDVPTMYRDVQVPREDRMSKAAFPVGKTGILR
jgi:hypothetical protein